MCKTGLVNNSEIGEKILRPGAEGLTVSQTRLLAYLSLSTKKRVSAGLITTGSTF